MPLPFRARTAPSLVGPASTRAVLPSGDRIKIESPWPTPRKSTETRLLDEPDQPEDDWARERGAETHRMSASRTKTRVNLRNLTVECRLRDQSSSGLSGPRA